MEHHTALGLSRGEFEALREQFSTATHEGRTYRHLPRYRSGLEKGTVLFETAVVRGFPKVPRTLTLETGVPEFFDGPFAVEEKLNGYNVRVARVDGEALALTRSGVVCPYSTWWVREHLPLPAVFERFPEATLCGELVGPENPYTAHDYDEVESLAFRAFDLRDRAGGDPWPVAERREALDDLGVPQVPLLATTDPESGAAAVREVVDDLDARDREGVVMKSTDGRDLLKYTTSAANCGDLASAFALPFDYGRDFVFRRVVREAFQSVEWGEDEAAARERAHRVGEAIVRPMVETLSAVDDGETVGERHTVRGDPDAVEALLAHLRDQGLALDVERDAREAGERVVAFRKVTRATNDKATAYLDGHIVRE